MAQSCSRITPLIRFMKNIEGIVSFKWKPINVIYRNILDCFSVKIYNKKSLSSKLVILIYKYHL